MHSRRIRAALCLLIALALTAAACGSDDTPTDDTATDDTTTPTDDTATDDTTTPTDDTTTGEPLVELTRSQYGEILASGGFALYLFTPDRPGESTCFDSCAALWPPLEGAEPFDVGPGLDGSRFALVDRGDGTMQVTYDDRPLYFYAPDSPGTTDGQGLNEVWFVIDVNGDPATDSADSGGLGGY